MADQRKGQGWHGDPEGHARAGRKGGLKRAENRKRTAQGSRGNR